MTCTARCLVGLVAIALVCRSVCAELRPLSEEELRAQAALVVTGTVADVKSTEKTDSGVRVTEYRLTIRVAKVEKAKAPGGTETVVARGKFVRLPPGANGSAGHFSANTNDRIAAVARGWELTLYLAEPKDGVADILLPNGFKVLKKP